MNSTLNKKTLFWNRVQLILVLIIFSAPLVGAWLFMEYGDKKFSSYGQLYQPSRPVKNLLLNMGDEQIELDSFRRQWIFLVVANEACGDGCENNLLKIRQLRHMQNNNMSRIRSVFLHSGMNPDVASDLSKKYYDNESYSVGIHALNKWSKILEREQATPSDKTNQFYIIDPAGNLMMSYPASADPSLMKKDIKRLLKASQIG